MTENNYPIATIELANGGIIKAELYPHFAPNTVRNFISLASRGFYDNLCFHRVIPGFVIQGGDPAGNGTGGPGYSIRGEFSRNGFPANTLRHAKGVLSMARSMSPNSAGSQFFIMHDEAPHLDGQYAGFGMVIEGIELVDSIAFSPVSDNDAPIERQGIKTITVNTHGVKYGEPEITKGRV